MQVAAELSQYKDGDFDYLDEEADDEAGEDDDEGEDDDDYKDYLDEDADDDEGEDDGAFKVGACTSGSRLRSCDILGLGPSHVQAVTGSACGAWLNAPPGFWQAPRGLHAQPLKNPLAPVHQPSCIQSSHAQIEPAT